MNQRYFISKEVHVEGEPLVGLEAKEYENATDSATLSALKLNKAFDAVVKKMIEYSYERITLVQCKSSCFLATKENMPYLIDCVEKACGILGIEKVPEVYIEPNESINAGTTGVQNPILVLNSGLLHSLNHEELMYIIGHELGHIKSEHVQYTMLADFYYRVIKKITDASVLAQFATVGLDIAIYSWIRSAEYTADRAGLLVCQHLPSAITAHAKLCGCPIDIYDQLDANMFLKQVEAFDDFEEDSYNKFLEVVVTLGYTHPLGVFRAKELMRWVQSGEYARILLRNSTWAEKRMKKLTHATAEALLKKNEKHDKALLAASKSSVSDADLELAKETTATHTGLDRVVAWGSEVIKGVKAKNDKASASKSDKIASKADEDYEKAIVAELAFSEIFKTATEEEIQAITKETLGNLRRVK